MAFPIAAIAALAQFAPLLFKYMGVEENSAPGKIVEKVSDIAKTVAGVESVDEAITVFSSDPNKAFEFKLQVMANDKELRQIYLADVADARKRDSIFVQMGKTNHRANAMFVMAWLVVLIALS